MHGFDDEVGTPEVGLFVGWVERSDTHRYVKK